MTVGGPVEHKAKDYFGWHPWFAWCPVRVYEEPNRLREHIIAAFQATSGATIRIPYKWVWLKTLERRYMLYHDIVWWKYRFKEDQ